MPLLCQKCLPKTRSFFPKGRIQYIPIIMICYTPSLHQFISLSPLEVLIEGLKGRLKIGLEVRESPGKGSFFFAKQVIHMGDFICEYKTGRVPFPRADLSAIEAEYEANKEGSYIVLAQDGSGRWWCFDANRRYHQYGRYI